METTIRSTPEIKSLPPGQPFEPETEKGKRWVPIVVGVVILALIIFGFVMLILADATTTAEVRDIFIIFMALILLLLMAAAILLVIQLATLINLLQNEIKPMLETLNETVNTVKGTTAFLSDNLTEPVIKLNQYMAGMRGVFDFLKTIRR